MGEKHERSEILDLMKGIAMLVTIYCHALQRAVGNKCVDYSIWRYVHLWHMPLFFIVSGYLAADSKKLNSISFIKNKFIRLIIPWFIWRWIEWFFMRFDFSGLLPFNSYVPTTFRGNLLAFIKQPFRPMWFLFDLFIFFVLLWFINAISYGNNKKMNWLLITISALTIYLYYALRVFGEKVGFGYNQIAFLYYDVQYWGFFVFGFLFNRFTQYLSVKKKIVINAAYWMSASLYTVIFGNALVLWNLFGNNNSRLNIIYSWSVGILCVGGIILLCRFIQIKCTHLISNAITFVGKKSMEYYTLQFLFLNCGLRLQNYFARWTMNFVLCMLICTSIIILIDRFIVLKPLKKILWGA